MKYFSLTLTLLFACLFTSTAQTHLEIFTGYQKDLNNRQYHFNMLNSGIQFSWQKSRTYELLLQLQKSWPIKNNLAETFYTSNPTLPVESKGNKVISPSTATVSLGHRFVVTGKHFNGSISILLYTGLAHQKIRVDYNNKQDYIVLNPDKTLERTGFFIATGAEYLKQLKNGRFFFQLIAGPQPWFEKVRNHLSYYMMAPLSLNVGYSYIIKSTKHRTHGK